MNVFNLITNTALRVFYTYKWFIIRRSDHFKSKTILISSVIYNYHWEHDNIKSFSNTLKSNHLYVNIDNITCGIMKYDNGDIYIGNWNRYIKSGFGRMKFENMNEYFGNWNNNTMQGYGIMKYKNGDVYLGQWHNNNYDGNGSMIYKNGQVYNGIIY